MRKRICICLLLIILSGIIFSGCKGAEEENKDESNSQSIPSALEQVQQLTDEIVTLTIAKDWAESLDKVNELQSNWNKLYPDIQKQGAKQEDVDAFVSSLNALTDHLITKNLNLLQESAEKEKIDEQNSEQSPQQSEEQDPEQSPQQSEEQNPEQSPQQSEEQNPEQSPQQSEEPSSQQSVEQEQDSEQTSDGEKIAPEEVLTEINPIVSASQEDLVIIASSVEVTKNIPKFMSLFKSPVPPDLFKLKYLVRHLSVASKLENWDIVSADFKDIMDTWESVQPKVVEIDANLKTQLVQSIGELEDVISSKNVNLTGVKSNFIIEQIESLTKTIEEKEKNKEKE